MEKTKPTITPIVIPSDKLQFLKKKLVLNRDFIREIMGGPWAICQETPIKIVSYHLDGIVVINRHWDKCIERIDLH